jgi:hypothetical protein
VSERVRVAVAFSAIGAFVMAGGLLSGVVCWVAQGWYEAEAAGVAWLVRAVASIAVGMAAGHAVFQPLTPPLVWRLMTWAYRVER